MTTMHVREMNVPTPRRWVPLVAGVSFTLSWVVGLLVFSSSTQVNSSGADVLRGIGNHHDLIALQYLLTEGTAAIALAIVVLALGRAAQSGWILTTGLGAVAVSLTQCALGLYLSGVHGDAATAGSLTEVINRLDGSKMLLLAAMALAGFMAVRRGRLVLPAWLGYVALALAVSIAVSGVGYLFLLNSLATAAWISLPLLLVWVTGAAIIMGRRRRWATRVVRTQ